MKSRPRAKQRLAASVGSYTAVASAVDGVQGLIADEALERAWLAHTDAAAIPDELTDIARAFFEGGWVAALSAMTDTLGAIKRGTDRLAQR